MTGIVDDNQRGIVLRAMEPEDLDMLYRIENDQNLWNVSVTNVPYSRYTLHNYIASSVGDIYKDGQVRLMIENCEGAVVGIVDIVDFNPVHRRAEVGIVIANSFRRQGYASEALRHVAEYSLRVLHLHQLYAVVDIDNAASVELFVKMGYTSTAHLTNWLYDGHAYRDAIVMQKVLV